MKYLVSIIFALSLVSPSYGQQNILSTIGMDNFFVASFQETNTDIYVLRMKDKVIRTTFLNNPQYVIQKYDKNSLQLIAEKPIISDTTLTNDTVIHEYTTKLFVKGGKIHLVYSTAFIRDTLHRFFSDQFVDICYMQLDTNLNEVSPKNTLIRYAGNSIFGPPGIVKFSKLYNKMCIVYVRNDTLLDNSNLSSYIFVDALGNGIAYDTIPVKPSKHFVRHFLFNISEYPGARLIMSGMDMAQVDSGAGITYGFVLTDSLFNVIDTFYTIDDFSYYYSSNIKNGKFDFYVPRSVTLPTGSVIGGGIMEENVPNGERFTATAKYDVNNRFRIDTVIRYPHIDGNDRTHNTGLASENNIAYNSTDNLVYQAEVTHQTQGNRCTNSYNYLEITAIDTNMKLRWQKFIYSGEGYCMFEFNTVPCVGRSGVLVGGPITNTADPTQPTGYFLYRIDSSSNTGVENNQMLNIRDRVEIRPNPARDRIIVDDILQGMSFVTIFDMMGKQILSSNSNPSKVEFSIGNLPPGTYIVRVALRGGSSVSKTFIKQ